jgi:hypothetical protein
MGNSNDYKKQHYSRTITPMPTHFQNMHLDPNYLTYYDKPIVDPKSKIHPMVAKSSTLGRSLKVYHHEPDNVYDDGEPYADAEYNDNTPFTKAVSGKYSNNNQPSKGINDQLNNDIHSQSRQYKSSNNSPLNNLRQTIQSIQLADNDYPENNQSHSSGYNPAEHYKTRWVSGIRAVPAGFNYALNMSYSQFGPDRIDDNTTSFPEIPATQITSDYYKEYLRMKCSGCGLPRSSHNPWRGNNPYADECQFLHCKN